MDDLTPAELAELFCALLSDEQAEFFNEVARMSSPWPAGGWCVQACAIAREKNFTEGGRQVVRALAEHIQLAEGEAQ